MTLDWVCEPVNPEHPAGEDLYENDDEAFGDYYFHAVGQLPEAGDYFKPGMEVAGTKQPDTIFDPKSVSLDAELAAIDKLLKRTRDLRLLVLRAQWSILAGDLATCVASVEALAGLLEAMPNQVHPVIDGSPRDRLDAINDLTQAGAMILPLRYLDLANSGTSLRKVQVAKGQFTPHDGEYDIMLEPLLKSLVERDSDLDELNDLIRGFLKAIESIEGACLSHDTPHTPQLQSLKDEIGKIAALLGEARPSLTADDQTDEDASDDPTVPSSAVAAGAPLAPATEVKSHDEARQRLTAVETYFALNEPSSAAVLLITQARLLIGKTLMDAFEVLMPNAVDRAVVEFTPALDFKLARAQLRALADEVEVTEGVSPVSAAKYGEDSSSGDSETVPEDASVEAFIVQNQAEASAQALAVETYFRAVEKSSPIPLLLSRARGYIGKDFESLMREFIPKEDY